MSAADHPETPEPAPTTLLVLGAGGDLTARLLLPGLGSLLQAQPGRRVTIVGADRRAVDEQRWHALVRGAFAEGGFEGPAAEAVVAASRYVETDLLDLAGLSGLVDPLRAGGGSLVVYFALPPRVTAGVCDLLPDVGLPAGTRLALEKPFGVDHASAVALNARLARVVPEDHVHRVDHFLGTSTVLNLIGLRFANRFFAPVWTAEDVERVEIYYDEDLALEGRAGYYDRAGALVDMLQSHLLVVLSVLAMENPAAVTAVELRGVVAQVLRATRVWDGDPARASRRARYTAGTVGGRDVPSYVEEDGVDPARETETLAEVAVEVRNQRWRGVPFVLRSGKALGGRRKEVLVHFRPTRHVPDGFRGAGGPDLLRITFHPETLNLSVTMNGPGDPFVLDSSTLSATLAESELEPYGEVLAGILDGDPVLSIRGDVAERCWAIVDEVLAAWRDGQVPLEEYEAGSAGPDAWSRPLPRGAG